MLCVSAERFFAEYAEAPDFPKMIDFWRAKETKSPPRTLAERLISEAGQALFDISQKRNGYSVVGADDSAQFTFNASVLLFGISIISIEETLKKSVFDPRDIRDAFERATRGRFSYGLGTVPQEPEYINHGDFLQMIYAASSDKKLTVFFREPSLLAKTHLAALRVDPNVLPSINSRIIPAYDNLMDRVYNADGIRLAV
jgi:hypothetical protein